MLRAITLFYLLLLTACSDQTILSNLAPKSGYAVTSDIVFDPATGLKLDVYTPTGAHDAPVVIFYYGGRWDTAHTTGKSTYSFVGEALASKGYVAVIPDYRLYPQVKFPAFVQDSAQAVRWVHDAITGYGGDPHKIVLMGHSSGAYNAAMLALNGQYLKDVGGSRGWLRGMIGLAGPYDFLPLTNPELRDMFGPEENLPQTQPVNWVDGQNPPLLLVSGEDDANVYVVNTRRLAEKVRQAGGTVTPLIYPKLSHEMILASLSFSLRSAYDVLNHIAEFVNGVTQGAPPPEDAAAAPAQPQSQPKTQPQ